MNTPEQQIQKDLIRDRFTRTAEVFGDYAIANRSAEVDLLGGLVSLRQTDRAVDIACGPGTLALRFAPQVRWICGLDLTPAMLARAQRSAAERNLRNLVFAIGDAQALPFPDASLDVAVTGYSLHHIPDPARVVREMARVLRNGGRAGILDLEAPEDSKAAELSNRIEKVRDPSHVRTLSKKEFHALFAAAGLHVLTSEPAEHQRSFDSWMHTAGWGRGDEVYAQTRRLLEETIPGDTANLHPQYAPSNDALNAGDTDITMATTAILIAGEKM